ncbi:hypothetical protein SAMN05421823_10751 [Catalinimonas alkaloidigena]|uniref:Glycosyl transferase family 2 n=1 Tax=Catalinimonas alkaloidigena TaxID=1075417 RepID=A0A1G9LHM4_9BACT|nr:hypothetical protein [Catalinimonas alkaloidigena]SDL61414.1 hypothetical protein SAMN05421823_10751 [Catalinimonas alkaloidigena]
MNFAHIINPVQVKATSDLFVAQPVTFESMARARQNGAALAQVTLLTAQYPEDRDIIPEWYVQTPDLIESVLDKTSFRKERKLPIMRHILDRLYDGTAEDTDYLIYSNADIALMPFFYEAIAKIIEQGYDAFVINRRTISKDFTQPEELPLMYAEVGKKHPGFDCFVFRRSLYPQFILGDACLGANWIGRVLIVNLMAFANKFRVFEQAHLTFHLGDDRSWRNPDFADYDAFNRQALITIIHQLLEKPHVQQKPEVVHFFQEILKRDLKYGVDPQQQREQEQTPFLPKLTLWIRKVLHKLAERMARKLGK